jgi:hypothetical protein
MQRRLVFLLYPLFCLGLGPAAFSEEDIEPGENRNLVLTLYDGQRLFRYDREATRREVESIFNPLGVAIHWTGSDEPVASSAVGPMLSIVLMDSDPSGPGWNLSEDTMGVFVHGQGRQRSVFIFYSNLARAFGIEPAVDSLIEPRKRKALSRALGRIIAHELVHAVSPALPHADSGLMCASLGASFFSESKVNLDRASRAAFLSGLSWMSPGPVPGFESVVNPKK